MPNRSSDWFLQAKRDCEKAALDFEHGFYEWCCFTAQQAAEKALKALYYRMNQSVRGHSLIRMLEGLSSRMAIPEELYHRARVLDRYYQEALYPNGFPEGSPFEFFDAQIAKEALDAARAILEFCENHIR
ncbi:MAG: HEPN domain-containing protein [Atribacterota bacterium]|nr:HEPN domain-containing protein [Atribacterota bacterium]